jgi:hypothetical protein
MKNRSAVGLSILAGGLAFVGSASAVDLVVNGSFEDTTGWVGHFKTYNYSAAYFTGPPVPASEGPANVYSWQHASVSGAWANFATPAADPTEALANACTQVVSLTNALSGAAIDAGLGQFTFSSWMASYGQPNINPEQPYINLRFLDSSGTVQAGSDVALDRAASTYWVGNADPADPTPPDLSNHMWSKFVATGQVPAGARQAKLYITRSFNSGLSGTPDTYVDLVKLNVININDTTILDSASPANNAVNTSPVSAIAIALKDVATAVDTTSIKLRVDNTLVSGVIQKTGVSTTIQYTPPALLGPLSTHTYSIMWGDNGSPVTTKSNFFQFSIAPYVNVNLGAPLYFEDFNSLAEGAVPADWTVTNQTDPLNGGVVDFNDLTSDAYLNWAVITRETLTNVMTLNLDYTSVLNVAPNQVVNNALVTSLTDGNFALAVTDGRSGKQLQNLTTKDYNLTGRNNVYLSFHSLYTQYQDSMGAVEYSIDGGSTWQPALYLLDGPDILHDAVGAVDGSNTLAVLHGDVPDLTGGTLNNGNYGQFIGVPANRWSTLGPYFSARVSSDLLASKRVEVVRLAQADNQPAVRVRFIQMGTDSWYWGLDNIGLYSISTIDPPLLTSTPADVSASLGSSATFSLAAPLGVGPFTYQWRHNAASVPGATNPMLTLPSVQSSDVGSYDVVVSNAGGSVTSTPAARLTVVIPQITGQWDFNHGDLRATVGRDLEYYDVSVQTNTSFGTTTSFGVPNIAGQLAAVMKFTPPSGNAGGSGGANPSIEAWGGYRMFHGAPANGGGLNVNQYTLIYDVLYPASSDLSWRAVVQASLTPVTGGDDSEYYINQSDGIGISGIYDGNITPDQWHRVALAVDMARPGLSPVVEKFIDGVKVGEQTAGLDVRDGRFSLSPLYALLFSENNGYNNDAYVSSVQFRNGRLSDAAIEAMGGPTAGKLPGAMALTVQGGTIILQWSGTSLQQADDPAGPWTTINGAANPYSIPAPLNLHKFYRSL